MMRVLGGEFRGRRLRVPETGTRPSSGRLRESLFSVLVDRIPGAAVLDLFAGSGALGIEALSRGAVHATFVEIDPRVLGVLRSNLEALGLGAERAVVRRADARRWLERLLGDPAEAETSTVCLLDPPYDPEGCLRLLPTGLRLIESRRLAVFALEHPSEARLPDLTPASGVSVRTRRHGRGAFTVLERVVV